MSPRLVSLLLVAHCVCAGSGLPAAPVSFGREVLPILSDNCFRCHGPDEAERKAGLRLDTREGATAGRNGRPPIVPGDPERSEVLARMLTHDPDELMPPPTTKRALSAGQIETFRRWIAEGAPWGRHWAFEPPVRGKVPVAGRNPVDAFVVARLAAGGLSLSPPAASHTLLRRLSFDLAGLPPTAEEVTAFLDDNSSDAWERAVDRLLRSPHFGERMAMWWLDAARYADTDGYQADETRSNWPWRDWVVESFNRNLPFDRFTVEQFAGDLLPDATPEQRLATCFHRNHMTNGEGGRDPEESRVDYVMDRVNTMGTVWLGLTLGCAQCHTHKFDPVSQTDYYRLSAFFNSIDEDGKAGRGARPYLSYQSPHGPRAVAEAEQWVAVCQAAEARARVAAEPFFADWLAQKLAEIRPGHVAWRPLAGAVESTDGTEFSVEDDGVIQTRGPTPRQDDFRVIAGSPLARVTGFRLEVFPHPSHTGGGLSRGAAGEFILTDIKVQVRRRGELQVRELAVASAVADFSADPQKHGGYGDVKHVLDDDPRNGWSTKGADATQPHVAVFALAEPFTPAGDEELIFELRHRSTEGNAAIGRFRVAVADEPGLAMSRVEPTPLERLAAVRPVDPEAVPAELRAELRRQFLEDHAACAKPRAALALAERQLEEVRKASGDVEVMVLAERSEPRRTHVLLRGVWDKPGEVVESGVPTAVAPWPAGEAPTRLGLARWLVSPDNPLTARVIVNQFWQLCFGAGLVRTPEDFGLQGEPPTHPELLDWLAVEFRESGWDVKHLLRLIVTSDTYRQSSAVSPDLLARDPENRLLARGARFRLPSWMLRDAALQAAGLLNLALGGPPVRPYQPEGVWEEITMGRFRYEPSDGAAQYRRTLYSFWRRSSAPTFLFDSAQRRVCELHPRRTNTPLQALTLLNDETFLEAARVLAEEAVRSRDGTEAGLLQRLTVRVLGRQLQGEELAVLQRELDRALSHYRSHPEDASRLIEAAHGTPASGEDLPVRAAHLVMASLLLNLDEAITRE